ncbi:amidohydrolase family protein [Mycobacterium deserti]|uniref:Amidohydrolase family protein n=1 Tax=Mycobacterium deserti TaxID=2978347 RepID=A0ABT2MIL1_9MYCO|nr:amidohydrolase family protein [Mycobacterium deserti]MCT7662123.1 amidohydrolase family protein [Mycobacterium deserti]
MGEFGCGARIFDAHLHIIERAFPLIPNDGYLPPPFTVEDYRTRVSELNVRGGAVVSGSFQGFDQRYLRHALRTLGSAYVGVTQIPSDTTDDDIRALTADGIRAVRFNVHRGGSASLRDLEHLARRVHEVADWHAELYIASRDLVAIAPVLARLQVVSIDHLGLSSEGLHCLLDLVDKGAYVKATGFGRLDLNPAYAIGEIMKVNPGALVFGTDLPSTRAPRPFRDEDLNTIADVVGAEHLDDVLWGNAARLYRIEHANTPGR